MKGDEMKFQIPVTWNMLKSQPFFYLHLVVIRGKGTLDAYQDSKKEDSQISFDNTTLIEIKSQEFKKIFYLEFFDQG